MITVNELLGNDNSIYESVIASIEEKNKKIEELKNMNFSKKQFTIFKMFYNRLIKSDQDIIKDVIKRNPFILIKIDSLIYEANFALEHKKVSLHNRKKICPEIMAQYNLLINKILVLAKEMGMSNSLEICILYSYLLWNGYLSKTKKNVFESEGRKFIDGLYFAEIMDGIGVCLNHADMLRDILNASGYTSVMLENLLNDNTKVNYKMDIIRNCDIYIPRPQSSKLFIKKKADHVFNLIEENNKIYIYDSTNFLLYNLVNSNYCDLVNGNGRNKLFPYQSYCFTYSNEEEKLLDRVFTDDTFISPYTKTDLISTSEVNLEIIKNSTNLLEDFYTEAKTDIIGIAEKTDKIIKKIKK